MKRAFATVLALILLPLPAYARVATVFERECRQELDIGDIELKPGIEKQKLRNCIRTKASDARRPQKKDRTKETKLDHREKAKQKAITKQKAISPDVEAQGTNELRTIFHLQCREEMGIEEEVTVKPGPQLAMLHRCVEKKIAAAKRSDNRYARRTSVEARMKDIANRLLRKQSGELEQQLKMQEELRQKKIDTQKPPSIQRYFNIRESGRARTDFSRAYREGSTASKKANAQDCRRKKPSEWAACIREALSD